MNPSVSVGQRFGHLTVIAPDTRPQYPSSWLCRCDCGKEIYVSTSVLMNKYKRSCGCQNRTAIHEDKDLTGKRFGQLTVLSRIISNGRSKWLCQCDCGIKCEFQAYLLLSGRRKSCGHHRKKYTEKDLTGRRFGHLTVLCRTDKPQQTSRWHCMCDCGAEINISTSTLLKGQQLSCGKCHYRITSFKEKLIGKRYHHLTVRGYIKADNNKFLLLCRCDCGEFTLASTDQLHRGRKKDCGCGLGEKNHRLSLARKLHTSARIRSHIVHSNTGYKGVYKCKSKPRHPYYAEITCQGLHYNIGNFKTLEEALTARLAAEEKYFRPLIIQIDKDASSTPE